MKRKEFESLMEKAVAELPALFRRKLENIAIVVEEIPAPDVAAEYSGELLMGLYHGVPLPDRNAEAPPLYPDVITLYQRNIESVCETEEEIVREVQITIRHEIGHYFGLDDDRMDALEE
ncbi:MAG: hypothetical protein A2Z34_06280 [Planctomycetes bacterium RBG_16_59_8]|nr:MAG: hypothetical protein A2Z34_06280 [Planctomycetes bacterium RBG_16_59_8]